MFEIVWVYRCGLLLGNTVWAASIVLSSFMAGLALGNGLVGWSAPANRLVKTYAVLELVVAGSGIGLTYVLGLLPAWLAPLTAGFLDARPLVNVVRFATAFVLLLLPATAMGATFPVLVGALSRSPERFSTSLGRLYGWNTLGA